MQTEVLINFSRSPFIVEWNVHVLLPCIQYCHGGGSQWQYKELLDFSSLEASLEIRIISKHNCSYFLNLINVHIPAANTPQKTTVKTTVKRMTAINASSTMVTSAIPATLIIGRAVEKRERAMERAIFCLFVLCL